MTDIQEDRFLGGRVLLRQYSQGYRAGADPVFLAAAVPATPGESVLELGCGAGAALYCLMARVPDLDAVGVEMVESQVFLARENGNLNDLDAQIVHADLSHLPKTIAERTFDHVFFNPPYFDRSQGSVSPKADRETGRGVSVPLDTWSDVALRRLRPGGQVTMIHRVECLPYLLALVQSRVGRIRILPLQPREGVPARLFVLNGKKGAKAPFSILPSLVLHKGERHVRDENSYTREAEAVLREGASLAAVFND